MSPVVGTEHTNSSGLNQRRRLSPLTRRILAVNVIALAVLVVGLLYVGQYRQGLIRGEVEALAEQAKLIAAALADQHLVADPAKQIVRRLAATTQTRARLISTDGTIITDSSSLPGPGGEIRVQELAPPPPPDSTIRIFLDVFDAGFSWLSSDSRTSATSRSTSPTVGEFKEVKRALAGELARGVRLDQNGTWVLVAAVPVQRYRPSEAPLPRGFQVLGALMLTDDMERIDEEVFQVRLDTLKVFGVALLVTVLLSVYLAGTIARPIRRLAAAADRVRRGLSRQYALPDMGNRKDEIGDLGDALRDMTEALWKRMDGIEQFAADVAHEIKNPLSSLRSAVETVVRLEDPGRQKMLLGIIQDDISRLDRLISDISDASRLDSELSRAELLPVDVGGLLSTLVDLYNATREPGSVCLSFDKANSKRFDIIGLEDRLVQVFRNLISNAVSFSPEGGEIRLSADHQGGKMTIQVEDEGPGIPAGMEVAVFNRFYQERPSSEKFGTHSGLGLSISQQIVEAHGGSIHAENCVDESGRVIGARFVVQLPLDQVDGSG